MFLAYSDVNGCGPQGANHNWGFCGETDGNCPRALNVSLCKYGKALRTTFRKNPFESKGCDYNYYAEYTCKGSQLKPDMLFHHYFHYIYYCRQN